MSTVHPNIYYATSIVHRIKNPLRRTSEYIHMYAIYISRDNLGLTFFKQLKQYLCIFFKQYDVKTYPLWVGGVEYAHRFPVCRTYETI